MNLQRRYRGSAVTLFDAYFVWTGTGVTGGVPVLSISPGAQMYPFDNISIQINDARWVSPPDL